MGLSLLESLRRLVRQDLTRIARPVGNLHGAVAGTLDVLESTPSQSWLVMQASGADLPSLEDFYQRYEPTETGSMIVQPATDGVATVSILVGKVALARTVVTVTRAQTVTLELVLDTTTSSAGVYLNGILQRRVEGPTARVSITLTPGDHTLSVVVRSPRVQLRVPTNLALAGLTELLPTPQWRSVTTGYLDAQAGTAANLLEWVADPQAGGYRILRRTVRYVQDPEVPDSGQILDVSGVDTSNRFTMVLSGDHTGRLTTGDPLLVSATTLGTVISATVNAAGNTEVVCRLPSGLDQPNQAAIGQYCYTGRMQELVRVTKDPAAPVMQYRDAQVTYGETYEYAVQSSGLVDPTIVSALSRFVLLRAGDMSPPGPIVLQTDYPQVLNRTALVKFTTPSDEDYQGVRVYFRDRVFKVDEEPFVVQTYSTTTKQITIKGTVNLPLSLAGFSVLFAGNPVPYLANTSTASTITLHNGPATPPVEDTALTIYRDVLLKTDYGSPDRDDELTVNLPEYGIYYFSTFDRANNEQAFADATQWTYTAAADGFTGPPVLAIRQLSPEEQSFFFLAGQGTVSISTSGTATFSSAQVLETNRRVRIGSATYTVVSGSGSTYTVTPSPLATVTAQAFQLNCTDVVNYVVLELWAYDPSKAENAKYNGVTLYYQRGGGGPTGGLQQDATPIAMSPIPSPLEAFPNLVTEEVVSKTVTTTTQTPTVGQVGNTTGLKPGMVISGNANIPAGTTITEILDTQRFRLSTAATGGAANITTTFTYGTDLQAIFDNPPTTRSRFVLVNRDYPQVRVWAENAQGQESDIATYVADHDTTPEVTLETSINPTTNSFTAVVVADDDTQAFTWKVTGGTTDSPTYTVDTRSAKRVVLSPALSVANGQAHTALGLGERRALTVTPYATYASGVLSRPGAPIERELVRTPRSSVTFDNRDQDGARSATAVTATFSMTPAPAVVRSRGQGAPLMNNRTGTLTVSGSTVLLTDTGTPNWVPGEFKSGVTQYFYAVLQPAQRRFPIVLLIQDNVTQPTSQLRLEFSEALSGLTGTVPYRIVDGAVLYRQLTSADPAYVATAGTEVFTRTTAFDLEFYATKNGCYPESPRRVRVDADNVPSLTGFRYREQAGALVIGFDSADDDATTWEVYERKVPVNGQETWPTLTGVRPSTTDVPQANTFDRTFLTFYGSVEHTSRSRTMPTASGTWYAIGVPYNTYGEPGLVSLSTYQIGSSTPFQLADMRFTPTPGSKQVTVEFNTAGSGSEGTVSLTAIRRDLPNSPFTTSGTTNGFSLNIQETVVATGGLVRTFDVTATLQNSNTITRTFTARVEDLSSGDGGGGATTVAITGSALVTREGSCFNASCGHYLSSAQIRTITWLVTATTNGVPTGITSPASPYFVKLEVSRDDGTTWSLLRDGLPASQQGFDDVTQCLYTSTAPDATVQRWTYRLTVTDATGLNALASLTLSPLSASVKYCSEGGSGGADQ